MKYALLSATIILISLGQLLLKKGTMDRALQANVASIVKTLFNPFIFSGYIVYAVASIIGLFVIKKFPLSVAFPAMSVTYVIIVILSAIYFHEKITLFKLAGVLFIMIGVGFLFKN